MSLVRVKQVSKFVYNFKYIISFCFIDLVSDTDCLVIVSVGKFIENWLSEAGHRLDELKEGGVYTDKEILEIVKMIEDDPRKSLPCLGPKMVEGEGEVVPVWRDGRSVWHSKKFYFKLIEDFFVGCKKPGGKFPLNIDTIV